MTSEEIIRLDQRVVGLEGVIITLQQRVSLLESQLASANTKIDTLNEFYGGAISTATSQLMTLLGKVTSGTTTTTP